jgi:uncharacterized protein (TIGR03437 family)
LRYTANPVGVISVRSIEKSLFALLFTVAAAAAPPVIDVYNAASMIPAAIQNVAQGSRIVFRFAGTGIGPARRVGATQPFPITAGLAGLTLQVNVGSPQAYPCILVYAAFEEVGAILPSNVPLGDGQLTLYYTAANGTATGGPTAQIHVVPVSFGIYTLNGLGAGPALVDDPNGNQIDVTNPAHNGDTIRLRGTGLGKIDGDETVSPPRLDLNSGAQVFVGGQPATISYGGRAGGGPGNDRIDFVVPDGVSGCYVALWVKVGGLVTNFTTIPITSADQSTCSDPALGISGSDLQPNANGGLNAGVLDLIGLAGDTGDGQFSQFDADTLVSSPSLAEGPSIGSCIVYTLHGTQPVLPPNAAPGLDAGLKLNVSSAKGMMSLDLTTKGNYTARLGGGGGGSRPPYLFPGVYTIDNGGGGADVGPFSVSITIPTTVVWSNAPTLFGVIPRTQDLQINWSGGGPSDVVVIFGFSASPAVPNGLVGEFLCTANVSDGQFMVPADVMANVPATALPITSATAALAVGSFSSARFTARGLDFGYVWSLLTTAQVVAFQ